MTHVAQDFYVEKYFKHTILEFAEAFGYSDENIKILQLEDDELFKKLFPDLYSNIMSKSHVIDNRTPLYFAQGLVKNWVIEDIIEILLSSDDFKLIKSGGDIDRDIRIRPTNAPDYQVLIDGKYYNVELQLNFTKTLSSEKTIPIRDNKFNNMKRDKDFLLVIDCYGGLSRGKLLFTIFDTTVEEQAEYIPNFSKYNKPVYLLYAGDNAFIKLNKHTFKKALSYMVQARNNNNLEVK